MEEGTDNKFSVICPTMWMSSAICSFLKDLVVCDEVDEIIIINNNISKTPKLIQNDKIKLINLQGNIGVNPAWNLGVEQSKNKKLAIINDDMIFDTSVFNFLSKKINDRVGIIGLNINSTNFNELSLTKIKHRPFGFACCFFVHKNSYYRIPDEIKIFFGDDWLVNLNTFYGKNNYCVNGLKVSALEVSVTSKHFVSTFFFEDEKNYEKNYKRLTEKNV